MISISKDLKFIYHRIQNYIRPIPKTSPSCIFEFEGVKIDAVGYHISPIIEKAIRAGLYERAEIQILKSYLDLNDIVMEIGAGIGFLSSYCAKQIGSDRVFAYEANPKLENAIRSTYQINNVNPNLQICLVGEGRKIQDFYITKNFWSSSFVKPTTEQIVETISAPMKSFNQEVQEINPSLLVVDIEGGEYEMFRDANLHNIQKIIIELHNSLIGNKKVNFVKKRLNDSGFEVVERIPNCDDEILFLKQSNYMKFMI